MGAVSKHGSFCRKGGQLNVPYHQTDSGYCRRPEKIHLCGHCLQHPENLFHGHDAHGGLCGDLPSGQPHRRGDRTGPRHPDRQRVRPLPVPVAGGHLHERQGLRHLPGLPAGYRREDEKRPYGLLLRPAPGHHPDHPYLHGGGAGAVFHAVYHGHHRRRVHVGHHHCNDDVFQPLVLPAVPGGPAGGPLCAGNGAESRGGAHPKGAGGAGGAGHPVAGVHPGHRGAALLLPDGGAGRRGVPVLPPAAEGGAGSGEGSPARPCGSIFWCSSSPAAPSCSCPPSSTCRGPSP